MDLLYSKRIQVFRNYCFQLTKQILLDEAGYKFRSTYFEKERQLYPITLCIFLEKKSLAIAYLNSLK